MSSKPKSFWRFYAVTALILAGAAAFPLRNFFVMIYIVNSGSIGGGPQFFSVASVIPFMAALSAILIGFLLLPALWNMSMIKRRVVASVVAVAIFFGLGLLAESISVSLDDVVFRSAMLSRAPSRHVIEQWGIEWHVERAVPGAIPPVWDSRIMSRDEFEALQRAWEESHGAADTNATQLEDLEPTGQEITIPEDFAREMWMSRAPPWLFELETQEQYESAVPDVILPPIASRMWIPPDGVIMAPLEEQFEDTRFIHGWDATLPEEQPEDEYIASDVDALFEGGERFEPAVPDVIPPAMASRMWTPPAARFDVTSMYIPWFVRIHYYIFSVVLILAVLNFLYSFANLLFGDRKPGKRVVILHGVAAGCYALAYFFVRVMQYENHTMLLLTWGSVLNAAICFILAAIAAGLYCASFIKPEGWRKFIPPVAAAATVLALYAAQYAMLGGQFYAYSESAAVTMFLRVLIVAIPSVTVGFLARVRCM